MFWVKQLRQSLPQAAGMSRIDESYQNQKAELDSRYGEKIGDLLKSFGITPPPTIFLWEGGMCLLLSQHDKQLLEQHSEELARLMAQYRAELEQLNRWYWGVFIIMSMPGGGWRLHYYGEDD
jgi:hypothetical protein